ncbi:MAG TPA: SDR family oxidoreductase [Methylococcaceae bacterium]|nr:SDR family oxidoreductase [Methylococcaceae bacterium]
MFRKPDWKGQVVIVTGASSGIGRATALAFARAGATTILVARSRDTLEGAADEIRCVHPDVRAMPADVSRREEVQALVGEVDKEFGRIDVLVNNAGGGAAGTAEQESFLDDFQAIMATSFSGKVFCVQAVLPIMRRQGSGHIVNISSVVGRKAFPGFGAYSAAMHAVAAFSDALRQELAGSGIGVSTLHPALTRSAFFEAVAAGAVPAPFHHMRPMAADYVAGKIMKAVRKKQPRVVIPWQPNLLLWGDALSAQAGDRMVRLLAKPWFLRLIGMCRGKAPAPGKAVTVEKGRAP